MDWVFGISVFRKFEIQEGPGGAKVKMHIKSLLLASSTIAALTDDPISVQLT